MEKANGQVQWRMASRACLAKIKDYNIWFRYIKYTHIESQSIFQLIIITCFITTMQDKQPIIVRLIEPARPLLSRARSPVHSIFSDQFKQLPSFQQRIEEDQKLNSYSIAEKVSYQQNTYTVYRRHSRQTWDLNINKKSTAESKSNVEQPLQEDTLYFESNFESGNLRSVDKVLNEQEYNLLMQKDINTYGYTQWFFFKVTKAHKNIVYKFNLMNFYKAKSLYQKGMKILVYSLMQNKLNKRGWYRGGEDIEYFQNGLYETSQKGKIKNYYTLSFKYKFDFQNDQVFFAYNYPYTYTDLNKYLDKLQKQVPSILKRSLLTRTLAGNKLEYLTITNVQHEATIKKKKGIIITGRVHPGETVSSYIVKGVIDYLTSDDENAFQLRENFVFKIVPMINPDGVIHGNYRANLSGGDLNRKWERPSKLLHPEIYYLKKLILEFSQNTSTVMFCDMHGHSRKKNAFIYGCSDKNNPFSTKQFPFLISKASKCFSFQDCSFSIKQDKKGTARVVLWKTLGIPNIYTLETSFCGPSYNDIHFGYRHFQEIGRRFCETLLVHFDEELNSCDNKIETNYQNRYKHTISSSTTIKKEILRQLYNNADSFENVGSSSGSDSEPEIDQLSEKTVEKLRNGQEISKKPILRRLEEKVEKTPKIINKKIFNSQAFRYKTFKRDFPNESKIFIDKNEKNEKNNKSIYKQKISFAFLEPKIFNIIQPTIRNRPKYSLQSPVQGRLNCLNNNSLNYSNAQSLNNMISQHNLSLNRTLNDQKMYTTLLNDMSVDQCEKQLLVNRRIRTQNTETNKVMTIEFQVRKNKKNVEKITK